jgi:hypothetical protein
MEYLFGAILKQRYFQNAAATGSCPKTQGFWWWGRLATESTKTSAKIHTWTLHGSLRAFSYHVWYSVSQHNSLATHGAREISSALHHRRWCLNGVTSHLNTSPGYKYLPFFGLPLPSSPTFFQNSFSKFANVRFIEPSVLRLLNCKCQLNMFPPSAKSSQNRAHVYHESLWSVKNYTIRLNVCFVLRTKKHA